MMKITWMGHACFLIDTRGIKIVTDPFNKELGYPVIPREAEAVTVSHQHWDHNAVEGFTTDPMVIQTPGDYELASVRFRGISSFHDKKQGKDRGKNIIFKISSEEIELVHLGDLGHVPDKNLVDAIGRVDVLLVPVGGTFTLNAEEAFETVRLLAPRLVIPMHYQTPHLSFSLDPVEAFTVHFDRVIKKPCLELVPEDLAGDQKVIVLDYLSC